MRKIFEVLVEIPEFVAQIPKINNFPHRHYNDIFGFAKLWQADLMTMPEDHEYNYALVVCDVFSQRVFARALKDKTSESVKVAFESIFEKFPVPEQLQSDEVFKNKFTIVQTCSFFLISYRAQSLRD